MRKIHIAALLLACTLFLGGCHLLDYIAPLTEDIYDAQKYQTEYADHWQYRQLTEEEQRCYGHLYTAIQDTKHTESYITFNNAQHPGVRVYLPDATLNEASVTRIYQAFFNDNPHFFYLDRTYSMEGVQDISGATYYNVLILQYTLPTQQRTQAEQKLQAIVDAILAECPSSDDYAIEQYLHDEVAARCTYDTEAAENDSDAVPNAYTAYGALVEGKAVCEGYAKALHLLLNKKSIPSTLVTGVSKENDESHMWNLVTVNGENYHVDPTWDDSGDRVQHTYFNLTTEMVLDSCTIDNAESLPLCTATKDNPFVRNDTLIDTYERQVIAQKIAARVQAGDTTIQLRFTEGKLDNGILFLKNQTLLSSMVNGHLADSGLEMWDYELWSERSQNVLTLIKKA